MKARTAVWAALWIAVWCSSAAAQDLEAERSRDSATSVSLTLSGLWSIQPSNERLEGGPYLVGTLGDHVAGVGASVSFGAHRGFMAALEVSTTRVLSGTIRGRLFGPQPTRAEHRDTVISFLPGYRSPIGKAALEYKAGLSIVPNQSRLDHESFEADSAISRALSSGIDAEISITDRLGLVPTIRYTYVFRGDESFYFGLGSHVVRAGLGLRFR